MARHVETDYSYTTIIEVAIGGHGFCADVEVFYDYDRATGNGWDEPHYPARAILTSVQWVTELLPHLPREVRAGLEADCLLHAKEREMDARSEVLS